MRILGPFTVLFTLVCTAASAQNAAPAFQITPTFGVQHYTWTETAPDGAQLDQERGQRLVFGAVPRWNSCFRKARLSCEADVAFTTGTVTYQGYAYSHAGQLLPLQAQTALWDFQGAATVAYRLRLTDKVELEPIAGAGLEHWNRNLLGPTGYVEHYTTVFGALGARGSYALSERVRLMAALVVDLPFSLGEYSGAPRDDAQMPGSTLSPGKNPRFVVRAGGSWHGLFAVLEVETWKLSQSPENSEGLVQPDSTRTTVGVRMGYTLVVR